MESSREYHCRSCDSRWLAERTLPSEARVCSQCAARCYPSSTPKPLPRNLNKQANSKLWKSCEALNDTSSIENLQDAIVGTSDDERSAQKALHVQSVDSKAKEHENAQFQILGKQTRSNDAQHKSRTNYLQRKAYFESLQRPQVEAYKKKTPEQANTSSQNDSKTKQRRSSLSLMQVFRRSKKDPVIDANAKAVGESRPNAPMGSRAGAETEKKRSAVPQAEKDDVAEDVDEITINGIDSKAKMQVEMSATNKLILEVQKLIRQLEEEIRILQSQEINLKTNHNGNQTFENIVTKVLNIADVGKDTLAKNDSHKNFHNQTSAAGERIEKQRALLQEEQNKLNTQKTELHRERELIQNEKFALRQERTVLAGEKDELKRKQIEVETGRATFEKDRERLMSEKEEIESLRKENEREKIALETDRINFLAEKEEYKKQKYRKAKERMDAGDEHRNNDRFDDAVREYTTALDLEPQESEWYVSRGFTYIDLGRYHEAMSDAKTAVDMDPGNLEAQRQYIDSLLALGEGMLAERACQELADRAPHLATLPDVTRRIEAASFIRSLKEEIDDRMKASEYAEALYKLEKILEKCPKCTDLLLKKSESLLYLGRYTEAEGVVNVVNRPDDARVLYIRAMLAYRRNDLKLAETNFKKVLKCLPDEPNVVKYFKMCKNIMELADSANAHMNNKDLAQAITKLESASAVDPDNHTVNAHFQFSKATCYELMGQNERAIQGYSQMIGNDNKYVNAFIRRGYTYEKMGQFEHAMDDYEQAFNIDGKTETKKRLHDVTRKFEEEERKAREYYTVLGVPRNASTSAIKKAYMKLAKVHHPDRHSSASSTEKRQAERRFKLINEAYRVLTDGDKRRAYDKYLHQLHQQHQQQQQQRQHPQQQHQHHPHQQQHPHRQQQQYQQRQSNSQQQHHSHQQRRK